MKVQLSVLALFAMQSALAGTPSSVSLAQDVIGNLTTMKTVYDAEYAPADWKKKFAGYDLDVEYQKAIDAVNAKGAALTLADSRVILRNFIYSMRDYHTSISFVSTEAASLPFTVKGVGSKFFIVYIDRTKLTEAAFPFNVGDEVVTFDGRPTGDVVGEVQNYTIANTAATDRALAELYLTSRSGTKGFVIPKGAVTVGIRPQGRTDVQNIEMIWDYTPEMIQPRGDLARSAFIADAFGLNPKKIERSAFHPVMDIDTSGLVSADNPYGLGTKKAFTPDLGAKIWESSDDNNFYAYIYKSAEGKLVGYVRIPEYEVDHDDYKKAVADFAAIITRFESVTDSMIIDQVNNPGGSVFYLYTLASMLTTQPLSTPLHRMSITQADVSYAVTQLQALASVKTDADAQKAITDSTDGYPVTYEFAKFRKSYAQFIVSEWNAGRKLTNPYWIDGVDRINPAATHYSKPILLVTNALDFSGGDFFPAILQDNKRVTIFGTRTAGAGGYVNDIPVPNNIGVNAFRCTESIAERLDKNPIENLGITPDVSYSMTENDYRQNYADYVKAIQAAVAAQTR